MATKISEKARAFLTAEQRFAVLGTINPDGSIQQSVMWFDLEGDSVLMNTKRGRFKDQNMIRDNRVSLCVEAGTQYVTIEGTVEMIDDQKRAHADIHRLAVKYDGQEKADKAMEDQFLKEERITLIVTVTSVKTHNLA